MATTFTSLSFGKPARGDTGWHTVLNTNMDTLNNLLTGATQITNLDASTKITTAALKVTTGAGANKLLSSDADGDCAWTLTPNLTSLEVDTIKITTGAGANAVLVSDADGDGSWSLTPNLTSLEVDTLKITTGAAANKLLSSDADGDCAWTATPTLTTLEVGTVKITGGSPGAGKFLQSDADGDAVWATVSSGGGDFSDGGDTAGADRTLGNNDGYDLTLETSGIAKIVMGDANSGITLGANNNATYMATAADTIRLSATTHEFRYLNNIGATIDANGKLSIAQHSASPTPGTIRSRAMLNIDMGSGSVYARGMSFFSARDDSNGLMMDYWCFSPSPANGDSISKWEFYCKGANSTFDIIGCKIDAVSSSVGTSSGSFTLNYESEIRFWVCNTLSNSGSGYHYQIQPGIHAKIDKDGQFVDASAAVEKHFADGYEDRWGTICDKVQELPMNPWRSANGTDDGPWRFGASAEDFYEAFQLGNEPGIRTDKDGKEIYEAHIRPGDPAFLALAGLKELAERVKALEDA